MFPHTSPAEFNMNDIPQLTHQALAFPFFSTFGLNLLYFEAIFNLSNDSSISMMSWYWINRKKRTK